jgi:archaellum biogenesis ATPase FlaH
MNESLILSAILKDRTCYDTFTRLGNPDELSPLGRVLFRACGSYYGCDSAVQHADVGVVEKRAASDLSNPKHEEALGRLVSALPADVSTANFNYDLRNFRRSVVGGKLSLALANRDKPEIISKLLEEYASTEEEKAEADGPEIIDVFDSETYTEDDSKPEFVLWPKSLNDACDGGASRGHHILLVARPEKGKTLFAINMCVGFLKNGHKVLYIANEEPARDIRRRLWQRILAKSKHWIRDNRQEAIDSIGDQYKGRVVVAALSPGTFPEIRKLIDAHKPDVLVLDQLRNLAIKSDSRTNQLETVATEARNLAKKYRLLVVSITQAGDSASDKIYLNMSDIDSSKTGIPATVDLMVGIGGDEAMQRDGLLSLSLAKNKLSGNHAQFTVMFDPNTGVVS